ncbi:hypothetical protein LTR64_008795 [Lithohypha guttulata]|uniref:uncharacterized protein n=1 Tax=Lithohypha guttulata TaxID=1690604 RepID=UPI00315D9197
MVYGPELFEYTSGRWLYNESTRLAERRVVFNVDELKKAVAKCLNQAESEVREVVKLAEGGFNRVFQLTMRDGTEVLARLPYPSTKPKRFAVASEVATLELVRSHGIPVPKVLHYSPDAENPVGAEFIIMEKLPGRPLGDQWFSLSEDQRLKVISEVVRIEVNLSKIDLPAYGSIYYKHDLPADVSYTMFASASNDKGLCVGPDVSLRWWYKERESLDVQRGPQEHADNLKKYLKIASYLVPQEARFHKPVLRHPDLQPNNIFVSENFDIVGMIDWQHCSVLPQFLAAGIPKYFQNYHDEESLQFIPPQLPSNLAEMDNEEQAEVLERFRRRHLHFFYLGFTQRFHPAHFEALNRRTDLLTRKLVNHAGEPWEGNNIPLKSDLIHITQVWRELLEDNGYDQETLPSCPISFTEADVQKTIGILGQQEDTDTQLSDVRDAIGITVDGWTSNEEYDNAVEHARLIKRQGLESLDTEEEKEMTLKHWPFDDFDEEDL